MLLRVAARMVLHEAVKYLGAVLGVALAIYLILLQAGFYFGFRRDITKVIDIFDAQVWIVPPCLLTFDYAAAMDDLAYWRALSQPGVAAGARMVFNFGIWRQPGGGAKESVQVLGIDLRSGVELDLGAPFPDLPARLAGEGGVLVDERDRDRLGIQDSIAGGLEIQGRRGEIRGFLRDKHLFSTSCLVVTDLDNGRAFLGAGPSEVHFVALRLEPGAEPGAVAAALRGALPDHGVLTADELRRLTRRYWESQTGVGPVLLLSAALALVVGVLSISTTFYILTREHAPIIAAMKAMGAFAREMASVLLTQLAIVFATGCVLAGAALWVTLYALSSTRISVLIDGALCLAVFGGMTLCALAAASVSLRQVARIEAAEAFRT